MTRNDKSNILRNRTAVANACSAGKITWEVRKQTMNAKAKSTVKIAVSLLMALVLVLGLFAPIASVAHADETENDSSLIAVDGDEQQEQKDDQKKSESSANYLSAGYLIPVICVLAVLIGFYIFLSVKTGKKRPKKPTGKKPIKKP